MWAPPDDEHRVASFSVQLMRSFRIHLSGADELLHGADPIEDKLVENRKNSTLGTCQPLRELIRCRHAVNVDHAIRNRFVSFAPGAARTDAVCAKFAVEQPGHVFVSAQLCR